METLCQQNKIIHPNNSLRDLKNLAPQIESEPVVTIITTKPKKVKGKSSPIKKKRDEIYRKANREKINKYNKIYYLRNRREPKIRSPYTTGNKHHCWKGYQEIPQTYFGHAKSQSVKRKLQFDLTIEYLWEIFIKQNRLCSFSGEVLNFNSSCRTHDGTASLDRIDSTKGYVKGNVQWVHKDVNYMKQDMTDDEFVKWCERITNFKRASV